MCNATQYRYFINQNNNFLHSVANMHDGYRDLCVMCIEVVKIYVSIEYIIDHINIRIVLYVYYVSLL
jgi:hypothetical protein